LIELISSVLTVYIWVVVCLLLLFLFAIAKFYEEKSGQRSYYQLFLIPVALFAFAAARYAMVGSNIVGDFWGDLLRCIGGIALGVTGFFLLRLMIGGRP